MGDADGRRSLGAEHLAPACTTHYSVVDRHGNMAAVTQTRCPASARASSRRKAALP